MSPVATTMDERLAEHTTRLAGLRRACAELRASDEVPALLSRATAIAVRSCGFDRAVVLAIRGSVLEASDSDALPDLDSDRLRRQMLEAPVIMERGSLEAELVDAVRGAREPARGRPSVVARHLGLRHAALDVVTLDGRPVALIVLDRVERRIDELDEALVGGFAIALGAVLGHAVQRARLGEIADELRHLTAFTQALMHETCSTPMGLPRRRAGGMSFPLVDAVSAPQPVPLEHLLTAQELRVAHLLAEGRSNREIADELVVSVETVKSHVARVLRKLDVSNRAQAVARILGAGFSGGAA